MSPVALRDGAESLTRASAVEGKPECGGVEARAREPDRLYS